MDLHNTAHQVAIIILARRVPGNMAIADYHRWLCSCSKTAVDVLCCIFGPYNIPYWIYLSPSPPSVFSSKTSILGSAPFALLHTARSCFLESFSFTLPPHYLLITYTLFSRKRGLIVPTSDSRTTQPWRRERRSKRSKRPSNESAKGFSRLKGYTKRSDLRRTQLNEIS